MEKLVNRALGFVEQVPVMHMMLVLVALCLLLVLMMGMALLLLSRRTRRAEKQVERISQDVGDRLTAAAKDERDSRAAHKRELDEAMSGMQSSVVRMVGEMSRVQQGQMDALGGQMRAAGRMEEERMERMRLTMEQRLGAYEAQMNGVNRTLEERLAGSEERMEDMRRTVEAGMRDMRSENQQQMELMRRTVDEKLSATVDRRLEASFDDVTRRLEEVTGSLAAIQGLAGSVDALRDSLTAQPMGVWGEVQLGALLSQMLAPDQYAQHACVRPGGDAVADYVVVMPGQGHGHTVYLPLDASLPMREYTELRAALENGTREEVDSARGLLESSIRMHARRMSEKLLAPPYTTDYGVIFLQSEGLFAEVLRIGGLAERIQNESRMVIAGPTTLCALLSSLQMGFKSLAIEQRTQEIMALLSAVRTDVAGYAGMLTRTQKKLRQAAESIEDAQRQSESISRRLSDMGELPQAQAKELLGDESERPRFDDDDDDWD